MREPIVDRLRQGPLLCDGAMGTVLFDRAPEHLLLGRCFDELVLTAPEVVQTIHRDYIQAGAQVIETNTFGANSAKLQTYGLAERMREINIRAAKLAREAREIAGQSVFVAGAVGPTGLLMVAEPGMDETRRLETLRGLFREQIEALMEGGVDLLILETFSNLEELRQAVLAAREAGSLPVVAQMTFGEDGQSPSGATPADAARALAALQVEALGVNCSIGPAGMLDAAQEMRAALGRGAAGEGPLLAAMPNAGLPTRVENRFLYVSTPRYFADYARRFAEAGVTLIGGCCGTTPAHIAAMRTALSDYLPVATPTVWQGGAAHAALTETLRQPEAAQTASAVGAARTRLETELRDGRFVVSVELDPPKGLNPTKILEGAAHLRDCGVQFINIADSPMARVRMSCVALARLLRDTLDMEAIIHFTTRDRNLMALQSDLLGAHALGIHNVLALTGDPLRAGNYPNLTGVWDVDSVGLIRVLGGLNAGHDAAGAALGAPASFHIGAALNLNMEDALIDTERERRRRKLLGADGAPTFEPQQERLTETELELRRLRHKLDAGADYIMTQAIYSIEPLERFIAAFGRPNVPVLLGMVPLHSSKHAEYLHNEVPGITIPEETRARMREAGEHGRELGITLAYEVVMEARKRGLIQGCYLTPSYGRYDLVGELAQELVKS